MPVHVMGTVDGSAIQWFRNILLFAAAYEILSLPFDLVGYRIELIYGKTNQLFGDYLFSWCAAALKHGALFIACIFCFTAAAQYAGVLGVGVSSSVLCMFLLWKQGEITRFLSSVQFEAPGQELRAKFLQNRADTIPLVVARTQETGFTGGVIGLPNSETIVIPHTWLNRLTEVQLWAEITRRNAAITSGSRGRGVYGAIFFTVAGVVMSAVLTELIFGAPLQSSAGAITASFIFTLWSFIGLLLLPSINQRGVMEVDQKAIDKGVSRKLLYETIGVIDKMMENEQERSDSVQLIFHPIPTPNRRLAALDVRTKFGAWHLARYSIWLSLAGLGLLSRAVHCNAGRPQLWCMLPAD